MCNMLSCCAGGAGGKFTWGRLLEGEEGVSALDRYSAASGHYDMHQILVITAVLALVTSSASK
jgi:hypothetical protein